jgi:hypothetical protein
VSIAVYRRGLLSTHTSLITLCRVSTVARVICRTWRGRACGAISTKVPTWARLIQSQGRLVPFFNPRTQDWATHFAWAGATIQPLTPERRVTVMLLHFNDADRVAERQRLMTAGLYE